MNSNILAGEQPDFYIDATEGGEQNSRRIEKFKSYLLDNQCLIHNVTSKKEIAHTSSTGFVFSPLQHPISNEFKKILDIRTVDNIPLSGSIVVKASTGINELTSLAGVRMGFLSAESSIGYHLPNVMFKNAGVVHDPDKITFTDTNFAAITLLLHQDVFSSVIATPLAVGWAKTNGLHIVATTENVETGGIWVKKSISKGNVDLCIAALSKMNRKDRTFRKLLAVFPYWLDGFEL
ncbi:MAG: phosphate/phosphite/phosphonate ABC transporter substrate-binding protein [Gammaproteobacteria bacterium]|nr:phosphate/phosphite/phosphonate ABC transporter substrate-binding protein [Gammaproteobacteria bacterium]